jgi:hypothetical protein
MAIAPIQCRSLADVAPSAFCCPITFSVFVDPVCSPAGHTYERSAIEAWLRRESVDPLTTAPLTTDQLYPNLALRDAILAWLATVEPAFAEEAAAHRGRVQAVRVVSCVPPWKLSSSLLSALLRGAIGGMNVTWTLYAVCVVIPIRLFFGRPRMRSVIGLLLNHGGPYAMEKEVFGSAPRLCATVRIALAIPFGFVAAGTCLHGVRAMFNLWSEFLFGPRPPRGPEDREVVAEDVARGLTFVLSAPTAIFATWVLVFTRALP